MKMSDRAIKALKPSGKRERYSDDTTKGLYLEVAPNGDKRWVYRFTLHGKRNWYSMGDYPAVSLSMAREEVINLARMVRDGINPIKHRQQQQETAKALHSIPTVDQLFELVKAFKMTSFGNTPPVWAENTAKKHAERYYGFASPMIGKKRTDEVVIKDLKEVLLSIQRHGTLHSRDKVRILFNAMFDYAQNKGWQELNIAKNMPLGDLVKHQSKNYKHATTPEELREALQRIEALKDKASYSTYQALRMAPYVFLRPTELVSIKWEDIHWERRIIVKEAGSMKARRTFIIPISTHLAAMLEEVYEVTGHTPYVFYSGRGSSHINRDTLSKNLRENVGITTTHGFRHTASSLLNSLGYDADEVELQMSHMIQGVRGTYLDQKELKLEGRAKMVQQWGDYLTSLKEGAKVVPFGVRLEQEA